MQAIVQGSLWVGKDLIIRTPDHPPALLSEPDGVLQVFTDLFWSQVGRPIYLDHQTAIRQREVRDVVKTKEGVLCPVRLPQASDYHFQRLFSLRWVTVQPGPIP